MYVRKFEKAKNAAYDPRFGRALRIAHQAWIGPQFEEDAEGFRIRVWGDPNEDWVRPGAAALGEGCGPPQNAVSVRLIGKGLALAGSVQPRSPSRYQRRTGA